MQLIRLGRYKDEFTINSITVTLLFSRERARAQHIRTEIGRLLRQHYEASSPPMPDRLAEIIKKMAVTRAVEPDLADAIS